MSEEQENAVIGRTLKEYQAAKKRLAALCAEAERIGAYLSIAGHALQTNHNLYAGEHSDGTVDLANWPTAEQLRALIEEIVAVRREKSRRAEILKDAGLDQPE